MARLLDRLFTAAAPLPAPPCSSWAETLQFNDWQVKVILPTEACPALANLFSGHPPADRLC